MSEPMSLDDVRAKIWDRPNRNFEIVKVVKTLTMPPMYKMTLMFASEDTYDVEVKSIKDITNLSRFTDAVADATNRFITLEEPRRNWKPYLDRVFNDDKRMIEVKAPPEASVHGLIWNYIVDRLNFAMEADSVERFYVGHVVVHEDNLYFSGPVFMNNVRMVFGGSFGRIDPREVWRVLRSHGAKAVRIRLPDQDGKSKLVRAWTLPRKTLQAASDKQAITLSDDEGDDSVADQPGTELSPTQPEGTNRRIVPIDFGDDDD